MRAMTHQIITRSAEGDLVSTHWRDTSTPAGAAWLFNHLRWARINAYIVTIAEVDSEQRHDV